MPEPTPEPVRAAVRVGIVMGSDSDWPVMEAAAAALAEFGVGYEADVVSAHRMPRDMIAYGEQAAGRGLKVIVAGAGGAAHLPGMLASVTPLPVIGVPVPLAHLDGLDSLLSIVQMPAGVPVATVSIGGARNAGLLAVRILAASDPALQGRLDGYVQDLTGYVVRNYAGEVATVISDTVQRWDADDASRRIELHVGRDLQFIRINGTVVGALAGLAIHTLVVIFQ